MSSLINSLATVVVYLSQLFFCCVAKNLVQAIEKKSLKSLFGLKFDDCAFGVRADKTDINKNG